MILISFAGVRRSVRALLQITGCGQEREIRGKSLRSLSEFATGGSEFASSPCGFITNGRGAEEKGRARRRSWLLLGKVSGRVEIMLGRKLASFRSKIQNHLGDSLFLAVWRVPSHISRRIPSRILFVLFNSAILDLHLNYVFSQVSSFERPNIF